LPDPGDVSDAKKRTVTAGMTPVVPALTTGFVEGFILKGFVTPLVGFMGADVRSHSARTIGSVVGQMCVAETIVATGGMLAFARSGPRDVGNIVLGCSAEGVGVFTGAMAAEMIANMLFR